MNRRDFLKNSAIATLSSIAMPSLLVSKNTQPYFKDYKALVVILQLGGNDSINMFIPSGMNETKGYDIYKEVRTSLAINNIDLSSGLIQENGKLNLKNGSPYSVNDVEDKLAKSYLKGFYRHSGLDLATNSMMPEIADLVNKGKIAIIANAGNIVKKTTKADLNNPNFPIPEYLGSHNSQRKMMMGGQASDISHPGWAGLLADIWQTEGKINGNTIYGMNISLEGKTHLMYGKKSEALVLNINGVASYSNMQREVYNNWLQLPQNQPFKKLYQSLRKTSFKLQDTLSLDFEWAKQYSFNIKNAYNKPLFEMPNIKDLGFDEAIFGNSLMLKLKTVANLIRIGKEKGFKRQIFFVSHKNYDSHANQLHSHPKLLREFSLALGDFQLSLQDMGIENEVTTFNISDFGRSVGNNGTGTDHAWGGHYFAMGGSVKGGIYGTLPDLRLGGKDDSGQKGRLIPSTSMTQYFATIVEWFGADYELLKYLFPDLPNFGNDYNLNFMKNV